MKLSAMLESLVSRSSISSSAAPPIITATISADSYFPLRQMAMVMIATTEGGQASVVLSPPPSLSSFLPSFLPSIPLSIQRPTVS